MTAMEQASERPSTSVDNRRLANDKPLLSATDYVMLLRLLWWVGDHGGGTARWPECDPDTCPSCQATYLRERLTGVAS